MSCPANDPTCPCQDGDPCHYIDDPVTGTKAMPLPRPRGRPLLIDGHVSAWVPEGSEERAEIRCRELTDLTPFRWQLGLLDEIPPDALVVEYIGNGTTTFGSIPYAQWARERTEATARAEDAEVDVTT